MVSTQTTTPWRLQSLTAASAAGVFLLLLLCAAPRFQGMQRNPGARTIEGELEGALVKARAISDANAGSFQKARMVGLRGETEDAVCRSARLLLSMSPGGCGPSCSSTPHHTTPHSRSITPACNTHSAASAAVRKPPHHQRHQRNPLPSPHVTPQIHWNRAARTDKGVSAVCQVVSAKLMFEPQEGFAARVNAHLPDQIRVFGVQRATEGFDARKFCDKRRYEYILPAWVFDPQACVQGRPDSQASAQPGRRSAAPARGHSAARLADEAAALAAIAAAVISAPAPAAAADVGNTCNGSCNDKQQQQQQQLPAEEAVHDELASTSSVAGEEIHRLQREVEASRQRFVFGDAQLQRLNALLAHYEGTHNFHNFTVGFFCFGWLVGWLCVCVHV